MDQTERPHESNETMVAMAKPKPKDLSHHLSRSTRSRQASSIKQFYKYFTIPGIGQLAGGLPNNYYFPFDTLEAKVALPNRWQPTPNRPVDPPPNDEEAARRLGELKLDGKSQKGVSTQKSPLNQPQDGLTVPHDSTQTNPIKKIDLATALQYGTAQGYPPLYYFLRQLTRENLHPNCPYEGGPEIILTCGNTDGFSKAIQALSNEWSEEKDWLRDREGILVEEFCYMNAIQAAAPRGLNVVPVGIDDEGMRADGSGGLKEVLENWDYKRGKMPHLMYTVTMGQNPTSGVLSLQRRRDIYELCCKYDIIIIEDDPYWYLQYPTATAKNTVTTADAANTSFNPEVSIMANGEPRPEEWKSSGYKFLDSLVPSYINVDTEGRVIRLDTFSKTVAPGCRLGWITAQPDLVERILRITETSTQQPSGFVQSIIAEMLLGPDHHGLASAMQTAKKGKGGGEGPLPNGEGWKADGWIRWLEGLRGNYERRMNQMSRILDDGKYLVKSGRRQSISEAVSDYDDADEWSVVEKTQLYSFDWPVGGMFIWLKVHFESHPLYNTYNKAGEIAQLARALWIFWTRKPALVLVSPGAIFSPNEEIRDRDGWKYFRLCFSAIDEDELGPCSKRLTAGVAAFFRIKDKKVIEELLEEDQAATQERLSNGMVDVLGGPC